MSDKENSKTFCQGGFTLIEMIGVLAIIAILAGMIAPNVIKMLQSATQDAEEQTLDGLMKGLEEYILANRIIPQSGQGNGTWATNIASYVDVPASKVYQTDLGCSRRYWFDPSTNLNGLSDNSAAYNQNTVSAANLAGYTTGSTASAPTNPRAMIISDLTSSCTNNILVSSVSHTTANFAAVWDQTGTLTESDTLKIKRINLSQIFETITMTSANGSMFSRQTYLTPSGTNDTPYPLITVPRNSYIYSIVYSSGGFGLGSSRVELDLGYGSQGSNTWANNIDLGSGVSSTTIDITDVTSTSDIKVSSELKFDNGYTGTTGYVDLTVLYNGKPQYKLGGQSSVSTISMTTPGTPEIISFNVINGTTLYLYDQDYASGGTGNLLLTGVIKESDSFIYSPGPPNIWGR